MLEVCTPFDSYRQIAFQRRVRLPGFEFEFQLYYSLALYLILSMPRFPHLQNGFISAMRINECVDVKYLEQWLVMVQCYISLLLTAWYYNSHGTISTSLLLERPYKKVCLYSHSHVMVWFSIWQDWPCGHVSLHPDLGKVGKRSAMWCHIVISLTWSPETCPMWTGEGCAAADHSAAGWESSLLREPLINLEPMFHLGNRTGFLQPYNSHFHV